MGEKVEVEQGFIVNFNFMFDTNVEVNPTKKADNTNNKLSSSFCFIIQARDSVDSLQNSAPMNAGSIKKGIAIKLSVHYTLNNDSKQQSFVGIWHVDETKDKNKYNKIDDVELTSHNVHFGDGEIHKVKID